VTYAGPELLAGEHLPSGFDCGSAALNDWLVRRALGDQSSGTSRTWVVVKPVRSWPSLRPRRHPFFGRLRRKIWGAIARRSYVPLPIMLPFIIQSSQLLMCCSIQLTMLLHQPSEGGVEIEAPD
jgi:hypothetical protein